MPIGSPSARALVQEVESKIDFTVIPGISAIESKLDLLDLGAVDEMLSAIESKIDLTLIPGISAIESKLDILDLAAVDEMLSAIESKIDLTVIVGISAIESKLDQWNLAAVDDMLSAIESKIDLTVIVNISAIESKLDANLPSISSNLVEAQLRAFRRTYGFATTNEQVANAAEVNLGAPAVVTVTFPAGATRLEAKVFAVLKANNQTAAEHNIGVTLQRNVAAGGWVDMRDLTANPALTLPEVDATADSVTLVEVFTITTGQTVQFRFQVDSDNAAAVNYTQTFVLSVEYDFQ